MKKITYCLLMLVAFSCKGKKEESVNPVCYKKSDIIGKSLKNYKIDNTETSSHPYFTFKSDSLYCYTIPNYNFAVQYSSNFDSIFVEFSPPDYYRYALNVNNCNEFTFKDDLGTLYWK